MIGRIPCCRWRQSDLRRRADWGAVGRNGGALFLLRRQNSDHPPSSQVGGPCPLPVPPPLLPSPSLLPPPPPLPFLFVCFFFRYTIKAVGYVSGNVKSPYQIIPTARIHIHPNYQMRRNANDIALVKLSRSIQFNKFIRPVCLPSIRGERPADVALPGNSGCFASPSSAKVFRSRRKGEADRKLCPAGA